MQGRDPAAASSHHERRKGEGMGRLSTKESQASAYAPSTFVTLTRIPVGALGIMRTMRSCRSYRESHLDPAKVASYERDLWDTRAAKGLEWMLDRRLMDELLRGRRHPQRGLAFARGPRRVLGLLARRDPVGGRVL